MDLVEAFWDLGPREPDERSLDRVRQRAAARVYQEIERLAQGLNTAPHYREEAVAQTICKLMEVGYRLKPDHPQPERQLLRYLRTALRHNLFDLLRKDNKELPEEAAPVPVAETPDASEHDVGRVVEVIDNLCQRVSATLRRDGANNLKLAVEEMKAIRLGDTSFDALVAREKKGGRSAVHQRHCRARKRMLAWITSECKAERLTAQQSAVFDHVVGFLRSRQPIFSGSSDIQSVEDIG